jgi:hypothetical protein
VVDDTDPVAYQRDSRSALREYAWFAIILLCIAALVAFKTHG